MLRVTLKSAPGQFSGNTGVHRWWTHAEAELSIGFIRGMSCAFFLMANCRIAASALSFTRTTSPASLRTHGMLSYHAPCKVDADGTFMC